MTWRPTGIRILAYAVSVMLIAITAFIGQALPDDVTFRTSELITLGLLLGGTILLLHSAARSKVTADENGVEVVNGYRRHRYTWQQVAGISLREGAPWPTLVTVDDERIMMFAIQRTEGASGARHAVTQMRTWKAQA